MEEQYFNRIVQEYSDMVYRIAYSYCKNKEDAEDIYQNVFLKLFDYSKKFMSDEHVKRWLIRVTVNECHSLYLSPWKKRRQDCQNVDLLMEEQTVEAFYEQDKWQIETEGGEVADLLKSLSKKYSTVLYLYYYEEYSTKEIARILGKRESTIRTQLMRGRDELRQYMTDLQEKKGQMVKGDGKDGRKTILC